ncbi:MAG: hypothetical protein B6D46_12050 [Polyangiaceae bacterium UTPRO1]|jgi:acyl-CoA synthetase (AMP-forming)/AMP-acid ligase II|nr:AMP-binding protein [Myxococcales bacterium]OQY65956.1 MAG: hypothetical protein B6D46_12050 [Polyangiaceae bacterium UTPRO1]
MAWERVQLPESPVARGFLDEVGTITEALVRLAEAHPDFACLVFYDRSGREERLTLGRLLARAGAVRAVLEARGLQRGGHVLTILPTGAELVAAYVGTLLAGGVPALASTPTQRAAEPAAYRRLIGGMLLCGPAHLAYCDDTSAAILRAESAAAPAGGFVGPADVDAAGTVRERAAILPDPDDVATVQFSSGSTGPPKGIRLSHRAMLNNVRAIRDGLGIGPRDVSVNWIPLYHDMGLIDAFLLPLLCGCPTVLIPTTDFIREPRVWLAGLHRYGGTLSWAPNFAYALCVQRLREEQLAGLDLSSWRLAINAAEPVLARTIRTFTERFAPYGFRAAAMTPAWGLAENVTIATAHGEGEPRIETIDRAALAAHGEARPTDGAGIESVAIGRCLPRCTIEIREGGRVLADRRIGEVWLRSDSLFAGYHRDPELTARTLVDGWLDTGDRGYLADGDLFFVARSKDLIIVAGEKYAPNHIEAAINEVPGVRAGCVVVFGVVDPDRGTEDVAAVVETRFAEADDAAATRRESALAELAGAIRSHVTRTTGLAIRHLELVPPGGIRKTTSGKLARAATRERYAAAFLPG